MRSKQGFGRIFAVPPAHMMLHMDQINKPVLKYPTGPLPAYGLLTVNQARGYKTFFMLNSAEHEMFSANKYENANNSWHFHIY